MHRTMKRMEQKGDYTELGGFLKSFLAIVGVFYIFVKLSAPSAEVDSTNDNGGTDGFAGNDGVDNGDGNV